jgi:hypothetical protein
MKCERKVIGFYTFEVCPKCLIKAICSICSGLKQVIFVCDWSFEIGAIMFAIGFLK